MKDKPKLIIGFFSIIVGVFIAFQFKNKIDNYIPATINALNDMDLEVKVLEEEIEELKELAKNKEKELKSLEGLSTGDKNIIDILEDDILKNRMNSGTIDVRGPGIVISMYDNQEERDFLSGYDLNDDVIHDIDIWNIINDLRLAGAEAISINNQRVVSNSEIFCGGPIIRINNKSSGTPFIIKAIGDPKLLSASVNAPGTYGDILKNGLNKGFETSIEDQITIPAFTNENIFKYGTNSDRDGDDKN